MIDGCINPNLIFQIIYLGKLGKLFTRLRKVDTHFLQPFGHLGK